MNGENEVDRQRRPRGGTVDTRDLKSPFASTQTPSGIKTSGKPQPAHSPQHSPETGNQGIADDPASVSSASELARVVDAWPMLPEHIRAAVLALVKTAVR